MLDGRPKHRGGPLRQFADAEAHSARAEYHSTVAETDAVPDVTPTNRSVGIRPWLNDAPAVLIANPTAHSGKAADWIRKARTLLDDAGVPPRLAATKPEARTTAGVREPIDDGGARVVICMG